jgi:DNA polymerase-1
VTPASADEIVFVDLEFVAEPGERLKPVCMVAKEQKSGRLFREWLEGERPAVPSFAFGPNVIMVAYYASAELSCYLALGWPFPRLVLDLYAEFRVHTNGIALAHGRGLLGAMQWFGLDGISALRKDTMRKRILAGGPYSGEEQRAILNYCQSDVDALAELFPRMLADTNLIPALWRGEFLKTIALAEHVGVPVDAALYRRMVEHWPSLQAHAIDQVNATVPVFEDGHFRTTRFAEWLRERGMLVNWPTTPTGVLALDEQTFRDEAARHPQLEPLRQVRQLLGQLHKPGLTVGVDGRNRCLLSPFSTKTGRNAPSTTRFIFGAPSFLRGLIRPEANQALAYVDWEQQEFGIAAALSGDPAMQEAYNSDDPYLAFAKFAAAVPEHATKESHPRERSQFKTTVLGVQYLIGPNGLACRLGVTLQEAEDLLDHHRRIFRRFWEWSDAVSDHGQLYGELTAAFGWGMRVSPDASLRTLRNFPMQANAAEMFRLGCIFATDAGVSIVAPVHDAVLIESDLTEIEHAVSLTQSAMQRASEMVLAGFPLRTEARIIRPPERFFEERGAAMWGWMQDALSSIAA